MTNCNCMPMPNYMADYIENVNKWCEVNKELIEFYLAWYQMWAPYIGYNYVKSR